MNRGRAPSGLFLIEVLVIRGEMEVIIPA
jgi:hypothetical protein